MLINRVRFSIYICARPLDVEILFTFVKSQPRVC